MGLASIRVVILGSISFLLFWILAVFPAFKLLPIGRTAGALAGAVLTVMFNVETPTQAYGAIDLSILGLLFGTMMVSVYLEKADMFRYLAYALSWRSQGGKDLLCRVCVLSAISSALFTNDTCCLVLTQFLLKLCRQKSLPPKPFLLALATSANIGSVATPIGNPQNLVIAVQSGIPFGRFFQGLLAPMLLGVVINTMLLLMTYWNHLSSVDDLTQLDMNSSSIVKEKLTATPWTPFHSGTLFVQEEILDGEAFKSQFRNIDFAEDLESVTQVLQANASTFHKVLHSETLQAPLLPAFDFKLLNKEPSRLTLSARSTPKWQRRLWKFCVYFVTALMLTALLYGLDMSWTALTAAVALMALDFGDAGPLLEKVSYPLLVFFGGMFISVDGFNKTGIPSTFWDAVEPYARTTNMLGALFLTLVVIVLSNVASNVPTVLLLGSRVAASAVQSGESESRAWLMLAWASTVGGNLTLVGSAANIIVSEQAAKAKSLGYDLTFFSHLLFGFPSTVIIAAAGLLLIRG
ncbi:hypothetical protein L7F22_007726 [Adiantum nelumboides]|nr:hypothetical protein [Adiantum nelumboides]